MSILRQFLKTLYNKIRNDRLRTGLLQVLPFWVASLITGLVAVVYSRLFAWAESNTHRVLEFGSWLIFLLVPAAFLLYWWIVNRFAP